jgi:hypothetical protein
MLSDVLEVALAVRHRAGRERHDGKKCRSRSHGLHLAAGQAALCHRGYSGAVLPEVPK